MRTKCCWVIGLSLLVPISGFGQNVPQSPSSPEVIQPPQPVARAFTPRNIITSMPVSVEGLLVINLEALKDSDSPLRAMTQNYRQRPFDGVIDSRLMTGLQWLNKMTARKYVAIRAMAGSHFTIPKEIGVG